MVLLLGWSAMHGNRHLTWGRGMGMAQLRVDGFCSLRAHRFAGNLVTVPITWPGGKLQINASVLGGGGGGHVRAEVMDEDLKPIEGMTLGDADMLAGDGIRLDQIHRTSTLLARLTGVTPHPNKPVLGRCAFQETRGSESESALPDRLQKLMRGQTIGRSVDILFGDQDIRRPRKEPLLDKRKSSAHNGMHVPSLVVSHWTNTNIGYLGHSVLLLVAKGG